MTVFNQQIGGNERVEAIAPRQDGAVVTDSYNSARSTVRNRTGSSRNGTSINRTGSMTLQGLAGAIINCNRIIIAETGADAPDEIEFS